MVWLTDCRIREGSLLSLHFGFCLNFDDGLCLVYDFCSKIDRVFVLSVGWFMH